MDIGAANDKEQKQVFRKKHLTIVMSGVREAFWIQIRIHMPGPCQANRNEKYFSLEYKFLQRKDMNLKLEWKIFRRLQM